MFDFFCKNKNIVIGMVHIGALPGSPLYDSDGGVVKLAQEAINDAERLIRGGVDGLLFGNENDRPYLCKASIESIAAMTSVINTVMNEVNAPFGANYLWDPAASIAIAVATGAKFFREIFTGVYASDMGLWVPDCANALRLRHNIGGDHVKAFFNINAEFSTSLDTRPIELRAKSAVFSSMADAILISGPITGYAVNTSNLRVVKEHLPELPVFANTGVNCDNVNEILSIADGCIVGTHFKLGGITWNSIDEDRVKRFMDLVDQIDK